MMSVILIGIPLLRRSVTGANRRLSWRGGKDEVNPNPLFDLRGWVAGRLLKQAEESGTLGC